MHIILCSVVHNSNLNAQCACYRYFLPFTPEHNKACYKLFRFVCPATFSVQHHLISFLKFPMFIFLSHPSVSPFLLQINVISVFQCVKALQLHKIQISWLPSSHKTEPYIDGDRVLIPITEKFLQKELIILKTY